MSFVATPTLSGAINNAGDNKALWLKIFSGEVLTEFRQTTQFSDRHKMRTITSGKSAQFPVLGGLPAATKYLAQGASVVQGVINSAEQIITIDGFLYESLFLSKIDEAFSHYDVRQEYSTQLGKSMAQNLDKNIASTAILAARAANVVTGQDGGSIVVNASAKTDGNALFAALFAARQTLDEKNIDESASAFILPAQYYLLAQVDKLINKFTADGNGDFSSGIVKGIAGLELIKTNNLPSSNVTGTVGAKYDVNATNTAALVTTPSAVGTVK